MAILLDQPYQIDPTRLAQYKREGLEPDIAELNFLVKRTENLPDGQTTGALLRFPVADGYAQYVVVQAEPLTLQHVSLFDGYTIARPYVRGLEKEDVLEQVARAKALARLCSDNARKAGALSALSSR